MTDDLRRWLAPEAFVVFLFHGVIRQRRHPVRNYTHKHLTCERFVRVLDQLRAAGTPVSMLDIVAATRDGRRLPPCSFAVTFDDGFANNATVAAPVLVDRRIPATFYLTTGFIDGNECSWIDLIEYAVERTAECRLELPLPGLSHRRASTVDEKCRLLDDIRRSVKSEPAIDPREVAADIWRQLGVVDIDPDPELDQKLTWDQVRALHAEPLFTVGGHGITHRILAFLDPHDLEHEVAGSLRVLRRQLAADIEHYSYPEGLATSYSARVIEVLQREGIICAPTAEPGRNQVGDDLFRLKRVPVV